MSFALMNSRIKGLNIKETQFTIKTKFRKKHELKLSDYIEIKFDKEIQYLVF